MIIFIPFCNFKAPFSCFNFWLCTPSFLHSRQEFTVSGGKAMYYFSRVPKRWKSYERILWCRWTPIVLMWLYETQKEDKKGGWLLAFRFSSFTMLSLKHVAAFVYLHLLLSLLFSSNSCSFRVLKSPFSFGPHYSSLQVLVACSIIFKVLSSHLHGATRASCFFPSIKYNQGKKDAGGLPSLKPLCLNLAVGQGRDAAAALHFWCIFHAWSVVEVSCVKYLLKPLCDGKSQC